MLIKALKGYYRSVKTHLRKESHKKMARAKRHYLGKGGNHANRWTSHVNLYFRTTRRVRPQSGINYQAMFIKSIIVTCQLYELKVSPACQIPESVIGTPAIP